MESGKMARGRLVVEASRRGIDQHCVRWFVLIGSKISAVCRRVFPPSERS